MAVCVCGEETAHDSSRGGAQGFSVTPIPHPRYTEVKGGAGHWGSGHSRVLVYVLLLLFGGEVKADRDTGGRRGEEAAKRPPGCGEGRRWKRDRLPAPS